MRRFSESEKEFLHRIVTIHRKKGIDSIPELQVARLLRYDLAFFALKWETKPKPEVTIFKPKTEEHTDKEIDNLYLKIADFIYFVEELVDLKFIKLQHIPSEKEEYFTVLYDRDKYKYDQATNSFTTPFKRVKIGENIYDGYGVVSLDGWRTIHSDFALDLEKCGMAIIYPLPLLENFVDNDFKTEEEIFNERQLINAKDQLTKAKSSLKWTRWTFFITLTALIITVLISQYGTQKINESQYNYLLQTIDNTSINGTLPVTINDTVWVYLTDTITVKDINAKNIK